MARNRRRDEPMNTAVLHDHGLLEYGRAWQLQHRLVQDRLAGRCSDTVLLLEHPSVYTIGRSGRSEHWGDEHRLRATGIPVYHVERGGSVTYHGPGQLVGYPIVVLSRYCAGPKSYMRLLEEVLIRTLADFGLAAERKDKLTGVWLAASPLKVAALGVRIVRGVTMHGFALNVTTDLAPFDRIVPCGLTDCRVTSMAAQLPTTPALGDVQDRLASRFADVFGLEWSDGQVSTPTDEMPARPVAG